MKIYRVHLWDTDNSSNGFEFYSSKVIALKRVKDYKKEHESNMPDIDTYDIPLTKEGVIEILNRIASHPSNG